MVQQVRKFYAKLEYITTLCFLLFVGWYLFVFQPNVQVSSRLYVDGKKFTFVRCAR